MNPPELTIDGKEMELFENDDPLSNSSVKAKLAWDNRDAEYVLVWWQSPFYIATENGGYSMTASLVEAIPDNIETIWVVDTKHKCVKSYDRSWYDDPDTRTEISPDDPRFENVVPALQYALDREDAREDFSLSDVPLP